VPTTLIWGRQDRATPLTVAEAARARFGWPLRVIDHAGDDPTLDQPDVFLKTLRQVLAGQ
jgi:pimeloyl-ACP methyl ester carboxylesterase